MKNLVKVETINLEISEPFLKKCRSRNVENYLFYSVIVIKEFRYKDVVFTIQYENGLDFKNGTHSLPTNQLYLSDNIAYSQDLTRFFKSTYQSEIERQDEYSDELLETLNERLSSTLSLDDLRYLYNAVHDETPKFSEFDLDEEEDELITALQSAEAEEAEENKQDY